MAAVGQKKREFLDFELQTYFFGYPAEFVSVIKYVRSLKFDQTPDYEFLRSILGSIIDSSRLSVERPFEWLQPAKHNKL
jgi:casein kinase 1